MAEDKWIETIYEVVNKLEIRIKDLENRCDLFNKLDTESAKLEQDLQKQIKKLEETLEDHDKRIFYNYNYKKEA